MLLSKYIENKILREVVDWVLTVLFAVLLFLVIQKFVYRNADVSGDSMTPTLMHNDKVIINLMSYVMAMPKQGDIVVFPYEEEAKVFIKRIIGLPGDTVDIINYEFHVNGEPLMDDFSYNKISLLGNVEFPVVVPEGSYFVLGDNRNGSRDSRYSDVGFIAKEEIIGKVSLRIWPLNKIGIIK